MAVPESAKTVTLIEHIPEGIPGPEHFAIHQTAAPTAAALQDGEVLVRVTHMSADPYLRSGCKSEAKGGAVPRPMKGFVVASVVESKRPGVEAGDLIGADLPFTTIQVLPKGAFLWSLGKHLSPERASLGVGILGMPGSTAYGGLLGVLRPKKKLGPADAPETIWISGAAGAVGSLVGQIAKQIFGCTVIGSCGGPDKGKLIKTKFGFDHAIDYKMVSTAEELAAKVKECAPEGIDMYFDNVGGLHFEAAMMVLRKRGRVAICGAISRYNKAERQPERFFPADMIYNFHRIEGFTCLPWLTGAQGNFLEDMAGWLQDGKLVVEETVFDGIEQWPLAFRALFTGANTGKVVIKM
mmetsp:Transcript_28317/g.74336  ORF Transcript_28317/g.74336 Transcript_28317/m.74336 type:complete len:353 (+) Transcript_28317:184-1242(+)